MGSTRVNGFDGKLSPKTVERLKFEGAPKVYWSAERSSKGLGVRVTATGKSVVANVGVNGERKFQTFGVVSVATPFAQLEKQALEFIREKRKLRVRRDRGRLWRAGRAGCGRRVPGRSPPRSSGSGSARRRNRCTRAAGDGRRPARGSSRAGRSGSRSSCGEGTGERGRGIGDRGQSEGG